MLRSSIQVRFRTWTTPMEALYSSTKTRFLRCKEIPEGELWKEIVSEKVKFSIPTDWVHHTGVSEGVEHHSITPSRQYFHKSCGLIIFTERNSYGFDDKKVFQILTKRDVTDGVMLEMPSTFQGTYATYRACFNEEEEGMARIQSSPQQYYTACCLWSVDAPAHDPSKDTFAAIMNSIKLI
eukprot:TRINITY_DN34230_c0_g1_i1.p1 TRINITY_DN34230_c0_g1~~TRINITY_DN34230_c0_g1_i1.p1  ORF type:complete len:195 (+),score=25.58 TRINITY_DN34230_c0_g1_i1:45-587(+)